MVPTGGLGLRPRLLRARHRAGQHVSTRPQARRAGAGLAAFGLRPALPTTQVAGRRAESWAGPERQPAGHFRLSALDGLCDDSAGRMVRRPSGPCSRAGAHQPLPRRRRVVVYPRGGALSLRQPSRELTPPGTRGLRPGHRARFLLRSCLHPSRGACAVARGSRGSPAVRENLPRARPDWGLGFRDGIDRAGAGGGGHSAAAGSAACCGTPRPDVLDDALAGISTLHGPGRNGSRGSARTGGQPGRGCGVESQNKTGNAGSGPPCCCAAMSTMGRGFSFRIRGAYRHTWWRRRS